MPEKIVFRAPLDSGQIQQILPHRDPFVLLDRVLELIPGKSVKAIKAVTQSEPWARGHFPGRPIMPGVLIIEAMAQAGAIMVLSLPENAGKLAVLGGVKSFRVKRMVVPGDLMEIHATQGPHRMGIGIAEATATVGGELAARGAITYAIIDNAPSEGDEG
jgi:3-hydroxyacyl-[acyl-carrier-protein] dehydratase